MITSALQASTSIGMMPTDWATSTIETMPRVAGDLGDSADRDELAGVGVDVGDEDDVDAVVEVALPHVEIERVLLSVDVSHVVPRSLAHVSQRRERLLGEHDRRHVGVEAWARAHRGSSSARC